MKRREAVHTKVITTKSDYRALSAFRYHIRRYLDFSDQAARAAGIEPKQYELLLALKGLAPDISPTVGALAEKLRTHHHSTVELINRAEANELVSRSRIGPRVLVSLTKKGERVLSRAVEERLEELRVAGPLLVKALVQLAKHSRLPASRNAGPAYAKKP